MAEQQETLRQQTQGFHGSRTSHKTQIHPTDQALCLREGDILDEESSRAGDGETGILWQRRARAKGPADARLGVPRDPTLQGDTFPNQYFSVLWLDHKSGLGWKERRALEASSAACSLMGRSCLDSSATQKPTLVLP